MPETATVTALLPSGSTHSLGVDTVAATAPLPARLNDTAENATACAPSLCMSAPPQCSATSAVPSRTPGRTLKLPVSTIRERAPILRRKLTSSVRASQSPFLRSRSDQPAKALPSGRAAVRRSALSRSPHSHSAMGSASYTLCPRTLLQLDASVPGLTTASGHTFGCLTKHPST